MSQFSVPPSGGQGKSRNPCVRNCCLDDQDVCLGCGRTLDEITGWNRLSEEERDKALALAAERRKARARW